MQLGEALDVRFIDDRVVPGDAASVIFAVPVEVGIDDGALRHEWRAVAVVESQVVSFRADRVAEHGRVPDELAGVSARVGVEQELVRIEAMSGLGLERPVGAEPVERAGADAGDVTVKNFVGVLGELEPVDLASVGRIEDADVDARSTGSSSRSTPTKFFRVASPACAASFYGFRPRPLRARGRSIACNPNKLPARPLRARSRPQSSSGTRPCLATPNRRGRRDDLTFDDRDTVVCRSARRSQLGTASHRRSVPSDSIYETHVKGFTKLHPRWTKACAVSGLGSKPVVDYIRWLE